MRTSRTLTRRKMVEGFDALVVDFRARAAAHDEAPGWRTRMNAKIAANRLRGQMHANASLAARLPADVADLIDKYVDAR
jgi:hypothetical protein